MLSCKEVVKNLNEPEGTSFVQRAEMRMHLLMCRHCSAYAKHLKQMKSGFKHLFEKITSADSQAIERVKEKSLERVKKTFSK